MSAIRFLKPKKRYGVCSDEPYVAARFLAPYGVTMDFCISKILIDFD